MSKIRPVFTSLWLFLIPYFKMKKKKNLNDLTQYKQVQT